MAMTILILQWTGCKTPGPKFELELDVFYKAVDLSLIPSTGVRWAAVTLPPSTCTGLSFGDSVFVSFAVEGNRLIPSEVERTANTTRPPISLVGEYIGTRSYDSLCQVGFSLSVSSREFESTEYLKGSTVTISAEFGLSADSALVFDSMAVVGRSPREPIRFK